MMRELHVSDAELARREEDERRAAEHRAKWAGVPRR